MADNLKFALALSLVAAGIAGFYWLSEQPMVLRVLSVLAGLAFGAVVAWFTEPGQKLVLLSQESVAEVKKVVWPTRKEATQSTAIVFAFVFVVALMLWLIDKTLSWVLYDLILGWKE